MWRRIYNRSSKVMHSNRKSLLQLRKVKPSIKSLPDITNRQKTVKDRLIRNINDKSDSDSIENDDKMAHAFAVLFNSEHVHNLDKTNEPFKSTATALKINDVQIKTIIYSGSTSKGKSWGPVTILSGGYFGNCFYDIR